MHGYMHNRGGLRRLGGASIHKIPNNQNRIPRKVKTAQKTSTLYNLNRATPCPVTITGICGHDAGITGHDQRNTQLTVREALIIQGLQDVDLLLIELEKTRSAVTSSCEVVSANLAKQSEALRDSNVEFQRAINTYIKTVKQDISSYAENTKETAQTAIKHDFISACQSIAAGVLKGNLSTQSSQASDVKIDKRLIYIGLTISVFNLILLIILLVR